MKKTLSHDFPIDDLNGLWRLSIKRKYPIYLFLTLCLNLVVAPAVYAVSSNGFTRTQAYALGLLGLVTVAFSVYLFAVMFQPEKF